MPSTEEHSIIVVGEPIDTKEEFARLAEESHVAFVGKKSNRAEILSALKELTSKGDRTYDALVTLHSVPYGKRDKEFFEPLGKGLKFVTGMGAGYDSVDLGYLDKIGAWYANTPDSVSDGTSTTAVVLIMCCHHFAKQLDINVRQGLWNKGIKACPVVRGFVVGILGMGRIGKMTRDKLSGMNMRIIYHNRTRLPPDEEKGAEFVSFDDLLKQSQLIDVHVPLSAATTQLLGKKEFEKMTPGVMIVNTSRGKVIDEEALVEAMKAGIVDRVGLDVYENEPKVHPYLLESDRTMLFPHWGFTTSLYRDSELEVLGSLTEWMETGKPTKGVNNPIH